MSDIYGIIDSWEQAKIAKKEQQYDIAARLYRICHITYNNGELPQYNPEWEFMGSESLILYRKMLRKVCLLERLEIIREEFNFLKDSSYSTLFLSNDWRKFISEQYAIIAQKYQEVENNSNCEHRLRNPFLNLCRKLKNLFI